MTKRFCDRCEKQTDKTKYVKFSYGTFSTSFGDGKEINIELCENCQKETGIFDFIEKNDMRYKNKPAEKSAQDQFFELFQDIVYGMIND